MSLRLTEAADADIERILGDSLELFGPRQLKVYSALIERALRRVAADPMGVGTSAREEIGLGVRSLRLADVAGRRGAASHSLYFLPDHGSGVERGAVVLRVLHDRMEPMHRVASAISDPALGLPSDGSDDPPDGR